MSTAARAAVFRQAGGIFEISDITVEDPRENEVLVRLVATGICATDSHVVHRKFPTPLPVVLGHEGAGVVERVGSAVSGLVVGDHVVLSYHSCGVCKPCLSAHAAYCERMWDANFAGARLDGSSAISLPHGGALHGHFFGQSSFSTFALTHQRNTIKIPKDVPLELMGPLGCGFQTGAGAVLKALEVKPGSVFAVFGVGAVGLAAVMAAAATGVGAIIAVDVDPARLDVAKSLGATHVINAKDSADLVADLRAVSARGVDYVLDTSGRKENLEAGVGALAALGTFGFVAFVKGAGAVIDASQLALGQSLKGIIQGDAISPLFIKELIELYRAGKFPIDRLVSFYEFSDINEAFADVTAGRAVKAVLRFDQGPPKVL